MELIDNISRLLSDDLKQTLKRGSRSKIAASCFSMFAFKALKAELEKIHELEFVPHPQLSCLEIIRMDYGMKGESMRMRVRAAVAGYMRQRWSVDASPAPSLQGHEYRHWLKDHLALNGVKNALLAPGYRSPDHRRPEAEAE